MRALQLATPLPPLPAAYDGEWLGVHFDSNTSNSSGGRSALLGLSGLRVAAAAAILALLLLPLSARPQTDVRTGIKASGTVKSPLLLAQFRAGGGRPAWRGTPATSRAATSISGSSPSRTWTRLEKLEPDPSAQGAVRVEGLVEPSGEGFQFTGEVFDLATAESVFKRSYPFRRAEARQTMHLFVDDVLEALTGERGICETKIASTLPRTREGDLGDGLRQDESLPLTHDRSIALSGLGAVGDRAGLHDLQARQPILYLFDLKRGASYPFSTRPGPNIAPNYSPDGKWIASLALSRRKRRDLPHQPRRADRAPADAQSAHRLGPCFSPNGGQVVFSSDRSGSPQIYVMDTEE